MRHKDGTTEAGMGDFFIFAPGEPHQIVNSGTSDLIYYCIADNPLSDHAYYPDSDKFAVFLPERTRSVFLKGDGKVDYFHGEDEAQR